MTGCRSLPGGGDHFQGSCSLPAGLVPVAQKVGEVARQVAGLFEEVKVGGVGDLGAVDPVLGKVDESPGMILVPELVDLVVACPLHHRPIVVAHAEVEGVRSYTAHLLGFLSLRPPEGKARPDAGTGRRGSIVCGRYRQRHCVRAPPGRSSGQPQRLRAPRRYIRPRRWTWKLRAGAHPPAAPASISAPFQRS